MPNAIDNLDDLIPDPQLARRLNKSLRTLARWDATPSLGFPRPIVVGLRLKRRRLSEVEAWLDARAIASLGHKAKGAQANQKS